MTQLPEVSSSRQDIRQLMRQRRRALTPEQQAHFAQQAAARMMAYPPVVMARTVALFLSFDGELDTQPLIQIVRSLIQSIPLFGRTIHSQ